MNKKIISLSVAALMLGMASSVSAVIMTPQTFTTGTIAPGNPTETSFTINQFDTSLGTLTRVTFTMSIETWGGYYEVSNATQNPSAPVSGIMFVGVQAYLASAGGEVPSGVSALSPISADVSQEYELPASGMNARLEGPDSAHPNVAGPVSSDALAQNFSLYEGSGTYTIKFTSSTASRHTNDGAVDGSFGAVSAIGNLSVTYEYDQIPEPATLSLVLLGVAALAVRRRNGVKA